MSFIIAVHVNEGIVLASDRRSTVNDVVKIGKTLVRREGIYFTNSTEKTFICPNGAGISTCGEASIAGKPITGYIKDLVRSKIEQSTTVGDMPQIILDYFKDVKSDLKTNFIIAGYQSNESEQRQRVYQVSTGNQSIDTINIEASGALWDGEKATITRIFTNVAQKQPDKTYIDLLFEDVAWDLFTLQDAVDFARYCVETTIQTMRFKKCVETVGGAVDILVITPDETRWLQKEELK